MAEKIVQPFARYRARILSLLLILAVAGLIGALAGCQDRRSGAIPAPAGLTKSTGVPLAGGTGMQPTVFPLSVRLSEGKSQPQPAAPLPVAAGTPLAPAEIEQILGRLPALPASSSQAADFRLPGDPIPPPRAGQTVNQAFPPTPEPIQPPPAAPGPLKVLRYSPEGEIPVAPFLSVTFNQPMVPLATLAALKASDVPVRLDPALPGTWRWLGTSTLTFEYDSTQIDRLPKATVFHATVPAGTKSAAGGALAQAVGWSFTTPPPKVTATYPADGPQPLDPLFFIGFDQRVDPSAVLETIRVTAGSSAIPLRRVGEAEIQKNDRWKAYLDAAQPGRWVAFQAQSPLPAGSSVTVAIGPGTPSAEGPLLTQAAQTYSFHTYAALKIVDHGCYASKDQCVPLAPFFIRFNNPLDPGADPTALVSIDPEIPGASLNIYGDTLQIQGQTQGQTTYTVTVSGSLKDAFGQALGQDAKLTFKVGRAEAAVYGPNQGFVTLDPAAKKPVFSVYAINYPRLDVKIYAAQPSDWPAYQQYVLNYQRTEPNLKIPGRQVFAQTIPVEARSDTLTEVDIDLSPVMDGGFGHFIVVVSPPTSLLSNPQDLYGRTIQAWVQVTQIGLDAFTDHSQMVVWASALADGKPLPGITVQPAPVGKAMTTGADGTVRADIPAGATYLVASQGADTALLPRSNFPWDSSAWSTRPLRDELRWYVFDDRQMYRPGEEVHFKGWLRRIGGGQNGDVSLVGDSVSGLSYTITDSQGNSIGSGRLDINPLGGFDLAVTLPAQVNLGYTQLQLTALGTGFVDYTQQFTHTFQIAEFRRPEFEVTARNETAGPYFAGGSATLAVAASYYAGGPLPDAGVTWQVSSSPSTYDPPNWPDFTFGEWVPWWNSAKPTARGETFYPGGNGEPKVETFTGKTDASGEHFLRLDFAPGTDMQPTSVIAQASVMDVNRQAWAGTTTLLVHPASLYVGLRSNPVFVDRGTPIQVDYIVTDLDGIAVPDRLVEITAARLDYKYLDGTWKEVEVDPQVCKQASAEKPATCTFQTPVGGAYRITAIVTDDQGRKNMSRLTRWVSGGKLPPSRSVQQEMLTLVPDKETYQPGETAHILVQAPFSPAEGLLTVNRGGIVETRRFPLPDGSASLEIPIEEKYIPNLNLQVDVNGSAPRLDDQGNPVAGVPPRPAFAYAQLDLSIPPEQRALNLQLALEQKELEPGGQTTMTVVLKDAGGRPVANAEMAVVVVDEAVLALSNYQMADPLQAFYSDRPLDLESVYARANLVLANPETLAHGSAQTVVTTQTASGSRKALDLFSGSAPIAAPAATQAAAAPMEAARGLGGQSPAAQPPIAVRTDFNPLAVFSPAVATDASGQASIAIQLPDNLTRYRVMVIAVDPSGRRFGSAETTLTARLPLMVRPSAPRFLNFGDQFELPVVLQNQTSQPLSVSVAARASNLDLTGPAGLRVTVPANDRVEVRFPAAASLAGTATLQVAAVSGGYADAATVSLPVYTPATTEAFATYGVIDSGAIAQPFTKPSDVYPQYGGLEISTSSTALQSLTDAVLYLVTYPYECTEQIASRMLAITSLKDVLTAFKAEGLPAPEELSASVGSDIQTLLGLQNDDGGFPYWQHGQESIPFNTIHTALALSMAQSKDYPVPPEMTRKVLDYLRHIEDHYPTWYSQNTRQTLSAYALFVRGRMGDRDPQKAIKLLNQAGLDHLSLDAIGWLWPALEGSPDAAQQLDQIRRAVNNRVVETAGAANFTTTYADQNYLLLGSDRRTDAILLDALIGDNPVSDLIPKIVNGLLAHRTRGHWGSTQEDVFILMALDHYFNTFESQTPDFVARIWLGQDYAGSQEFQGRSTGRNELDIPMSYLVDPSIPDVGNLTLSKDGAGRLYYRLGLRYSPTDLQQAPLDMGFAVQRVYEAVDNPDDVRQDPDGTWHIRAGARVRVRLTMVADNRRYHVALVDHLPAGLEIVNPGLPVSQNPPQNPESSGQRADGWWGTWYEYQNLRDDRAEAFTTLLWEGTYQYTYIARATTPGQFVVPPAKAEEMYSPEVFGRSGSSLVDIR